MFTALIQFGADQFQAKYATTDDLRLAFDMCLNGAQMSVAWHVDVYDATRKASITISGECAHSAREAFEAALSGLCTLQRRPRKPAQNYDVTVPVSFAVRGDRQLVDAEDFVRAAIEAAIDEHNAPDASPNAFQFNGDTVKLGSAKEA